MTADSEIEDHLRLLAPQVLGALARRYENFDALEDAVQEALLAAASTWRERGIPEHPRGWLIRVASRRLSDHLRGEAARRRREEKVALMAADERVTAGPEDDGSSTGPDDTVTLLFMCCHPALTPASQVALTLRAVGGLTTAEIASAFLVPEATMAQRISRAKQGIRAAGARFALPTGAERADRQREVLHVLYLVFNEGYTSTTGTELVRGELTAEAIRLTRIVHEVLPDDGEVAGLLALMLLLDARRPARTRPDGTLVPLAEQDRTRWDRDGIVEGTALITHTLERPSSGPGPYQLQAAIAALHAEATTADDTDWPQILALYELLRLIWPTPMVALNHAVAYAMVHGPRAGLEHLTTLPDELRDHHRLHAVRAHLHELAGDHAAAKVAYELAARRTTSVAEQRYLEERSARLDLGAGPTTGRSVEDGPPP